MPRENPYARFTTIHKQCPDLTYLIHFVEVSKGGGELSPSAIQQGLQILLENVQALVAAFGKDEMFQLSFEPGSPNLQKFARVLAEFKCSTWYELPGAVHPEKTNGLPGKYQVLELAEIQDYVFDRELTLGELEQRLQAIIDTLRPYSVKAATLEELDDLQQFED